MMGLFVVVVWMRRQLVQLCSIPSELAHEQQCDLWDRALNDPLSSRWNDIRIRSWLVRISPAAQLMESDDGDDRLRSAQL